MSEQELRDLLTRVLDASDTLERALAREMRPATDAHDGWRWQFAEWSSVVRGARIALQADRGVAS